MENPLLEPSPLMFLQSEPAALTHGKFIQKLWGWEEIVANYPGYCCKIITALPNGNACSIHYHKIKHETFRVLSGALYMELYAVYKKRVPKWVPRVKEPYMRYATMKIMPGQIVTLPQFVGHRFWAQEEPAVFVEASTHDAPKDSIRLVESGPIKWINPEDAHVRTARAIHVHLK